MNKTQHRFSLILVDDEPLVLSALERVFQEDPYALMTAGSAEEAIQKMAQQPVNLALVDYQMPGMNGLSLLKAIREKFPNTRVILLTAHGGVKEAVQAIKLGAVDFLEKPYQPEGLRARITQIAEICRLEQENRELRDQIDHPVDFDRLIGNSWAMQKLKKMIVQVAASEVSILIQGETGTGKELVAFAIHKHSPRAMHPFQPVDCGAISESVMDSELFGHMKGAFTGAHASTLGLIRSADKGTLFLDEVGELSLAMQAKLLRTIQEKEVRPVGDTKSYPVDVRVLAATNRNLEEEVGQGHFREDLFFRLNVITLAVPPLRERIEDIPVLARYFIQRGKGQDAAIDDIAKPAMSLLMRYNWPGNVRELENVIQRAVAIGRNAMIQAEDLPPTLNPAHLSEMQNPSDPMDDSMAAYERTAILNALAKSGGNRKKAAEILAIGEATLYRKIKKYKLA
jgi:DNA-binding NtrC family response regulator